MHLLPQKLKLRSDLAPAFHHSAVALISKTSEGSAPAKTHSSLNTKDERNIKIGIVALRTVSKWTDKAALTLEKLEGQDTSKHYQEHHVRLSADYRDSASGRGMQETGTWTETVVYPVPIQAGVSRAVEVRDASIVYGELIPSGEQEAHGAIQGDNVPEQEAHHSHALATVVEYYNESGDDEDGEKTYRRFSVGNDANVHTDVDQRSLDISSDEEEEDSDDEDSGPEDSNEETDSEEEDDPDDADGSEKVIG